MFRLFKQLTVTEKSKENELVFQLSDDVQIIIGLNEPPYYSRASLMVNGHEKADVTIPHEKIEKLQSYAQGDKETNELFLLKLRELSITGFANEVEKYTDRTLQAEGGFGMI